MRVGLTDGRLLVVRDVLLGHGRSSRHENPGGCSFREAPGTDASASVPGPKLFVGTDVRGQMNLGLNKIHFICPRFMK